MSAWLAYFSVFDYFRWSGSTVAVPAISPRLHGLRHMVQGLCCVGVRARAGSIPHRGDEHHLYWLLIMYCID